VSNDTTNAACGPPLLFARFPGQGAKGAVTLSGRADWDDDAAVWVADSDEVPGLVTEAETITALVAKRKVMIPELLALNGVPGQGEVAFEALIRTFDTASRAAA
jgi:hypothetical protein